jgi:putative molybdopterin biosynthesis protein
MGKGSGSVTAFSRADGFVRIGRNTEIVEADSEVEVTLVGRDLPLADLVVIGSHCVGLDVIVAALAREGFRVKVMAWGARAGSRRPSAASATSRRSTCSIRDRPLQRAVPARRPAARARLPSRAGRDHARRRAARDPELLADPALRMVNRNRGSGTRVLIDELLGERRPPGHAYEPRSHYAVAAAVAQKRADWGVAIETVARAAGLRFRPLRDEHYDFAVPAARLERPAVRALVRLLAEDGTVRAALRALAFEL